MITFPRKFMRKQELMKLGLPEALLDSARGDRKQRFAMKLNPLKSNSPIIFDTEELAKWMDREIASQVKAMPRG